MKQKRVITVTKRDGSVERFRPSKLINCLCRVMENRACDAQLADPLVRAVAMHLNEWRDTRPPTTNYVHRCVCAVLRQTGLAEVADDLAAQRRLRAVQRRRIRLVDGAMDSGGELWRKSAIVEMLNNEFGLRYGVSRFLAGQIEMQVFALSYRRIRKAFLRELVRNEVLAWGLADDQVLNADAPPVAPPPVASRPRDADD